MKLWLAKDSDGQLYMYYKKPVRYEGGFKTNPEEKHCSVHLNEEAFWFLDKEVTWENSPREIEIKFI